MITSPAFAGKRFAVLGLARSGAAAAEALLASGARVTAWDEREEARAQAEGADLADLNAADLKQFDSLKQRDDVDYVQRARVEARMAEIMPVVLEMRRAGLRPEDQGRERRS